MSIVVDASMAVSWLFEDEFTPGSHSVLQQVASEGAIVPSLWRLEVANVLRSAVRKKRCDRTYVDQSLERLARLPILIDQETDDRAWRDTRSLSDQEGLTTYDASYLELAIRVRKPLGTGDSDLKAAAVRRGVMVLAI